MQVRTASPWPRFAARGSPVAIPLVLAGTLCAGAIEVPVHVTWTEDPATTATLSWQRNQPGRGTVWFGLTTNDTHSVSDPGGSREHTLTLRNLQPQTPYTYRVASTDGYEAEGRFITAPAPAPDATLHFVVHGDLQGGLTPSAARGVVEAILAEDPEMVIHIGDLGVEDVEPGFGSWDTFFSITHDELARYVFMPVAGNHDWPGNPNAYYWRIWNLPPRPAGGLYYAYSAGNVRFIALDAEVNVTAQTNWLARELQAAANDTNVVWIIPYVHRPPYSWGERSGDSTVRTHFSPLFAQYGADIVFSGHSHNYQRTLPIRDVTYIVAGGGGGRLYSSSFTPGAHVVASTAYHFVSARIDGDAMDYRAIRSDGNLMDSAIFTNLGRHVRVHPPFPRRGETVRIQYRAAPGPLAGGDPIHIHLGIDAFAAPLLDEPMTFNPVSGRWEFETVVPLHATNRLAFVFRDPVANVWHNNWTYNWQALLDRVRLDPAPVQAGAPLSIHYEADMANLLGSAQITAQLRFGPDPGGPAHDVPMTLVTAHRWEASLVVPAFAEQLDLAFHNGTEWDTNHSRYWQVQVQGTAEKAPWRPLPVVVPGSPDISGNPAEGQNHPGDNFDLSMEGTAISSRLQHAGFGNFGEIYFNYDATNLYVGGIKADLGGSNNVFVLFLGMNTLTDSAWNLWHKSSPPNTLDHMHNVAFTEPMDIAIVYGNEYGDGPHYTNFVYAGYNFGQGIYGLGTNSTNFTVVPGSRLSQFDGTGTHPCLTADDDDNERTTRWEAALPWTALNAPDGIDSLDDLHVAGVIGSEATIDNDRYLSASVIARRVFGTVNSAGQYGTSFVTLAPEQVHLPHGDYRNDGLPNAWRHTRFGSIRGPGAEEDTDGDGMNNRSEYIADTDPLDAASVFTAGVATEGAGHVKITWPFAPGRVYSVFETHDLRQPWLPLSLEVRTNAFKQPFMGHAAAHYKVDVRLEP